MDANQLWQRYQDLLCDCGDLGIALDVSRVPFGDDFMHGMEQPIQQAYDAMTRLEAGEIANPDEGRMVGHYWLRDAALSPNETIAKDITKTLKGIKQFAKKVHEGKTAPQKAKKFTDILQVGIGGSALGPQLVADCLGTSKDKMRVHFLDNTDPDGIARTLKSLRSKLKSTLVLVVSKSGGTPETRNGMLETEAAYKKAGLKFGRHAVAVTGEGSRLDDYAKKGKWLKRFPMWDWVGGRTSVMSAVGLLPAVLQGLDIDAMLDGAAEMDRLTRERDTRRNPAAMLALMWHFETGGKGLKDMVMLPYKDRLLLLSRYLQQLIMESLGKELDLGGNQVNQGIAVYGNKGSTDQHAYVQQLRDGLNNFFATFLVVLQDNALANKPEKKALQVEPGVTSGDYLSGFWQGTRSALYESGRSSLTLTLNQLDTRTLGAVIALYERATGLYAELVNINAYHQPGVEAGKKAAGVVLDIQSKLLGKLAEDKKTAYTADELAEAIGSPESVETVFHILEHRAANKHGVTKKDGRYRVS
ncbi:MAG: glucose-6-phosphate isomerase [Phycisphaeraceae bacterium]|nr:glucose-6-phosphate isomerase [Phycisphaeraceae bacterium]